MEESQAEKINSPKIDATKCRIFLPLEMWKDTFYGIFPEPLKIGLDVFPFPIGKEGPTESIVARAMESARDTLLNENITPILVFPIGTVPQHLSIKIEEENKNIIKNGKGLKESGIKILAPAFKTRDDIFLVLRNGKKVPEGSPKGTAGIISKAEDVTTTWVAKIYFAELKKAYRDPLFYHPHNMEFKFPYETNIKPLPPGKKSDELIKKPQWHCKIAAGPELLEHFNKPEEWLAVVNLNSWICRRQELPYFTRALFCSLPEAFNDEYHCNNLLWFWRTFSEAGNEWLDYVQGLCSNADKACLAGKTETPSPMQSPAIRSKKNQVTELAQAIWSGVDFISLADDYQILDSSFPLKYTDFYIATDSVLWEIHKLHNRENLERAIFNKCVFNILRKKGDHPEKDVKSKKDEWEKKYSDPLNKFLNISPASDPFINTTFVNTLANNFWDLAPADHTNPKNERKYLDKDSVKLAFQSIIDQIKASEDLQEQGND